MLPPSFTIEYNYLHFHHRPLIILHLPSCLYRISMKFQKSLLPFLPWYLCFCGGGVVVIVVTPLQWSVWLLSAISRSDIGRILDSYRFTYNGDIFFKPRAKHWWHYWQNRWARVQAARDRRVTLWWFNCSIVQLPTIVYIARNTSRYAQSANVCWIHEADMQAWRFACFVWTVMELWWEVGGL